MESIEEFLEDKEIEKIINEIIELKRNHPLSEKDKLRVQKLQQKLNR